MKNLMAGWMFLLLASTLMSCAGPESADRVERPSLAEVKTVAVSAESVPDFYEAVGTIRSRTTTSISSRTMGHVSRVLVSEGDRVQAGQVLLEIDSRDAEVQVRRAEAGESEARESLAALDQEITAADFGRKAAEANRQLMLSTFERYRGLHERRSISDQEFDEIQAKLSTATAETERASAMIESAKARRKQILARIEQANTDKVSADIYMDYSRVVSPISGVVTVKSVEVGMIASPGMPLLTVEEAVYRLEAQAAESESRAIRRGDIVRVQLGEAGNAELQGKVSEVAPSADPFTRSTVVKVDLPSRPSLRSGSFGRAFFASGERSVISVPRTLVMQHGQLTSIYVLDERIVRQRLIRLGKTLGDRVEVLSGLQSGDLLILEPRETLADGIEVRQ